MEEIERTNDRAAMRDQIELLAPRIVIQTDIVGTTPTGRHIKKTTALVTLAYRPDPVAVSVTSGPGTRST